MDVNLFESPPINLFDVGESREAPPTPEALDRTARLAAVATTPADGGSDYIQMLTERTDQYRRRLENLGEQSVRDEIATQRHLERMESIGAVLQDMPDTDPDLARGAALAYQELVQQQGNEDAAWALELQAVERIQDLASRGDITQARLMLSNLENGDALDVVRDMTTRRLILQREIERAQISVEDQPWFRHLVDFVAQIIPMNISMGQVGNVDIPRELRRWYDNLFAGQRLRREAGALWDMPLEQFVEYIPELISNIKENSTLLGYHNRTEELNLWTSLGSNTPSALETNVWNGLDNLGFIPFTKIGRGALNATGIMVRNGARREAASAVAEAALAMSRGSADEGARVAGMTADEVVENLSVRGNNPNPPDLAVSLAMDADAALERGRHLLAQLPEIERHARLTNQELRDAMDTVAKRLEDQFGREVKDVEFRTSVETADQSTMTTVDFTLGRAKGGGFANEAMANRYLASLGYEGQAIRDHSGQWFARVSINMPENGMYTNLLNVKTPNTWRFLLGARNVGDEMLADLGQQAGNIRNRLLRVLVTPYAKTFRALRGSERQDLAQVIQAGENQAKWFTQDELTELYQRAYNRLPTQREFDAYQAARDINDMEFVLRSDDLWKQKVLRGMESVTFDAGGLTLDRRNAFIRRSVDSVPPGRAYDVTNGIHYTRRNQMSEAQLQYLQDTGHVLVTLEEAVTLPDGATVKNFWVRGHDMLASKLRRDQIPYRPGGHRMYQGKYFVKQAVYKTQPDTGETFLASPHTFIAARTRAEADFWMSRMEAARRAYKDGADLAVLDEILGGHAGLPDAEEFVRLVESRKIELDQPFGTFYDRELPSDYVKNPAGLDFIDPEESGFNGFLRTNGRMYYSAKGEQLPDFMGRMAPTLDPYEILNRSLMNIASLTSFSDYKISSVQRWVRTFRDVIDTRDMPPDASEMHLFLNAPLVRAGNQALEELRAAAIAQRDIIKRNVGWKTEADLRSDRYSRSILDWVAGSRVDGVIPNVRRDFANWWEDKNPIGALRGIAFDIKLGLFNVAQFPLQLSTAFAASMLDPVNGMRGWALIRPSIVALSRKTRADLDNLLDEYVKRGMHNGLGGFDNPREFKEYFRSMWRSGFFDIGGTHGLLNHYGPGAAMDGFASGTQRIREMGRFFFNEGERWNRMVAWRIAWSEVRKQLPDLDIEDPEFLRRLAGRAEDYSLNMSKESQAWWQRGVLSVPTQFWAYNARMMEAMLGNQFTAAQRTRLIIGQTLLWGSAGNAVTAAVSDYLKGEAGDAPDIDTFWGTLDRGLADRLIYETVGIDVQAGQRFGTGDWLPSTIRDLFGFSQYGEVSVAEMAGGATASILGSAFEAAWDFARGWIAAESGDQTYPLTEEALTRVAANISTVGNGLKAWMLWNYGEYVTNSGNVLATGIPNQTAFAALLGMAPGEMDEIAAMMTHNRNKSESVEEAARVITNYRVRALNHPDQRETLMEEINAFVRLLPEDIRRRAIARAHANVDPSLYEGLVRRREREEMLNNGQSD